MCTEETEDVEKFESLVDSIIQKAKNEHGRRFMVGICGYPGAGKTTIAAAISNAINGILFDGVASVIPMDGFHLSNVVLDELNLRHLKGIPETFDAGGFVRALEELRKQTDENVYLPAFDRAIDGSIEEAIEILPSHRILIVEGNYLLLATPPWNKIRSILDEVIFLDTAFDVIEPRLVERHILGGRSPEEARIKMNETDLPNSRLIESTKNMADRLFRN